MIIYDHNGHLTGEHMELSILVKGCIIGFSIAAPVGPIGLLCIRRTLSHGRLAGLLSGLGAATADGIYGAVAGFGLTFISNLLLGGQFWLRLAGGVFLCLLGVRIFFSPPASHPATVQAQGRTLLGAYLSTFILTLTNPVTILAFVAVFAGLGIPIVGGQTTDAAILVAGVVLGSAFWWLTLSTAVSFLRTRLQPVHMRWINRISGAIIAGFGVAALVGLVL